MTLAEDLAAALVRGADAQDRGDAAQIDDGYDELEPLIAESDSGDLGIALRFWEGWIDARDHAWVVHEPIEQEDWPSLARELAEDLRAGTPITSSMVLRNFGPMPLPQRPRRTLAHWVLLLVAIVFAVEFALFFAAALSNTGRNQAEAYRYLTLAIATFLTFLISLAIFLKRVPRAGLGLIGLLLMQPSASLIADVVAGKPAKNAAIAIVAAVAGLAALVAVARGARLPRTASESESAADSRR
jgi:hypothetical protein